MNEDDFQTNKQFMQQYLPYIRQVNQLEERLYQLDSKLESTHSPTISNQPGGGLRRELVDDIAKREELNDRINGLLEEAKPIKVELLKAIDHVGNPIQSKVLELRYIEGMSVTEISEQLRYSIRQVIRQCNHGIVGLPMSLTGRLHDVPRPAIS